MTYVIDGRAVAKALKDDVRAEIEALAADGVVCGLATVQVGVDYAAAAYERRLRRIADELGMRYRHYYLGEQSEGTAVARVVRELGADPDVHGVLVLRPLPSHIDEGTVFRALDPTTDVEAVHPENAGLLALGTPRFVPSTPAAVFHVLDGWLDEVGEDRIAFYRRSTIAVVGRSNNVGKPAVWLALSRGATVVSCHHFTSLADRLAEHTLLADILVVAVGSHGVVDGDMVREGVIAVDVGINPLKDEATGTTRLVGDLEFESVAAKAEAITPVPGGVGPITDVWLLGNVLSAARFVSAR
jgi:methylenetetrahydrofolate dehydrogenase (NADP+) / methenyltetrahydrofolate cyclohydrolase